MIGIIILTFLHACMQTFIDNCSTLAYNKSTVFVDCIVNEKTQNQTHDVTATVSSFFDKCVTCQFPMLCLQ